MSENERRKIVWNWRQFFTKTELEGGQRALDKQMLSRFREEDRYVSAVVNSMECEIEEIPDSYTACLEDNSRQRLVHSDTSLRQFRELTGRIQDGVSQWYCTCSAFDAGRACRHIAALALYYEKRHGKPEFFESDEEMAERIEREKAEQARKKAEEEKKRKKQIVTDAADLFEDLTVREDAYFNIKEAVRGFQTDAWEREVLSSLSETQNMSVSTVFSENDGQILRASAYYGEKADLSMKSNQLIRISCTCGCSYSSSYKDSWYYDLRPQEKHLCAHSIRLIRDTADYINENNPGDETDLYGERFLMSLQNAHEEEILGQEEKVQKKKEILLEPRVVRNEQGEFKLTFTASVNGAKPVVVRNLGEMTGSWQFEKTYKLSNKFMLDFKKSEFTDESLPWLTMLSGKSSEIADYNKTLNRGNSWYYTKYITMTGDIGLQGSTMDEFYEIAAGTAVSFTDKKEYGGGLLKIGDFPCRIHLHIQPVHNQTGKLSGVAVSGDLPALIQGSRNEYISFDGRLGRLNPSQKASINHLKAASKTKTEFSFRLGVSRLQEFYYRILPALEDDETVIVHDEAIEEVKKLLPPEPSFSFFADCNEGIITIRPFVQYGDDLFELTETKVRQGMIRDTVQEERVLSTLRAYCGGESDFVINADDPDELYYFLTQGIDRLSKYGTVKGSDAFYAFRTRPLPRIVTSVNVSLESGLLDLEIKTDDLSRQELLELLSSYRLKKKYHRLKSGDFIDLSDTHVLREIDSALNQLDFRIEDIITGKGHIPVYRALYVDQLLSEHELLDIRKNREMKSLIRNFNTVKDADYEVSDELNTILRPYQLYGFRWFNVLADTGFGGILADEMGLGKTVQFLSFVDAYVKRTENRRSSLVVCPASLVYNWAEEAKRFTPDLCVRTIAGNTRERNRIFKEYEEGNQADLYVTSYDLLKRDIVSYRDMHFAACVLDEAQYIKNLKTSAAKPVKVIDARYRFALTGTPIENRLSEIWSIFDFLMPGFLYDHNTFEKMFEIPIMKKKDQNANSRLKKMISPFILRRLKSDVLKDLPDKLEEVRYAFMEEEQRKLYDAQVVQLQTLAADSDGTDKIAIFAQLTKLRQICCDPSLLFEDYHGTSAKRQACMELIQSAIDGGHRILLFSQFTSMLALLETDLKEEKIRYFKITGSTPKDERLRLVHEFNEGNIPVFLISLKAGGTGLNLTGADIVIHYDPWWNLAATNQATDRAHRIGQTKEVTVYKLIAGDTIEDKILDLQNMKQDLADSLVSENTESIMKLSTEEILELLS